MSGTAVVAVVGAPVMSVLFFGFYLTKPNSASIHRQNVSVHNNIYMWEKNAVVAELLVGDHDPNRHRSRSINK